MRKALTLKNYGDARTVVAPPPDQPKHASKKNTKRWCRGKVGQEHDVEVKAFDELNCPPNTPQNIQRLAEIREHRQTSEAAGNRWIPRYDVLVCRACGRHLGWKDHK